jgi:hypothetical protein
LFSLDAAPSEADVDAIGWELETVNSSIQWQHSEIKQRMQWIH